MCLKYQARLEPKGRVPRVTTLALTTTTFMGRRARYLTANAKASARHQSDLLYSQSPHGKLARATSRRLKQRRKVAQTPPTTSLDHFPGLPPLSPELVALNELPLPESNPLFQAALTTLAAGRKQPPFEEDDDKTDPYSTPYFRYSENIAVVLHGDRMRASSYGQNNQLTVGGCHRA
ncbi:hypothetical protein B0H14DRAFT_3168697 [Mycena olivaceomarginata]|nr:hypothetical protein B0H14DRAFT_3168697 [Mycena olivaceomarginata]